MSNQTNFLTELRRRRVLTVAGAYIAIAWLATEIAGFLLNQAGAPGWLLRVMAIALVVGFPVAVIIAWVLQRQPDGRVVLDSSRGQRKLVVGAVIAGIVLTAGLSWLIVPRIEDPPKYPDYDPLPNSVAILPFLDPGLTPNEITIGETLYIALTEGLNASRELTQVKLKLNEPPDEAAALGRRVRVMALLAGRILSSAGKTQVEMRLLEIPSGKLGWTRTFDWDATQIMEMGTNIANGVLQSVNLPPMTTSRFAGTDNREAYDALLLGRQLAWNPDHWDPEKAIPQIQKAIDIDPGYVQAHLALANVIETYLRFEKPGEQERQAYEKRMEIALATAEQLAPNSADVISMLGRLEVYRLNTDAANRAFERALELDPDHLPSLMRYAYNLSIFGSTQADSEKGVRLYRKVAEREPLDANIGSDFALALYGAGYTEEAQAQMQKALELRPGFGQAYAYLAYWERFDGKFDQALYYNGKWRMNKDADGGAYSQAALFYADLGARQEALAFMEKGLERSPKWSFCWSVVPTVLGMVGEEELAQQYAARDPEMKAQTPPYPWLQLELLMLLNAGDAEQALQLYEEQNPQFSGPDVPVIGEGNYFGTLRYAWLLKLAGHDDRARPLLENGLKFLDQWCDGSKLEGFWDCDSRYIVHGLLQQKEQTLAELRRVIVDKPSWITPLKMFEDHGALDFLQEDPEFQHLMQIRQDRYAAQMANVREMERNGAIPPPPRDKAAQ
jgi:tetratricopeptide (TPR) repeat protein/TolB-like protein